MNDKSRVHIFFRLWLKRRNDDDVGFGDTCNFTVVFSQTHLHKYNCCAKSSKIVRYTIWLL